MENRSLELGFALVILALAAGMFLYLDRRLVRHWLTGRVARRWGRFALVLAALVSVGAFLASRVFEPSAAVHHFRHFGYATIGFAAILVPFVFARDVLGLGAKLLLRLQRRPVPARVESRPDSGAGTSSRREFLRNSHGALLGAGFATGGLSLAKAAREPALVHVEVPIEGLPKSFDGYRIAQISDLHVEPHQPVEPVRRLVERALALEADLIAVTGDLIDGWVEDFGDELEVLEGLSAPDGVAYVTGNHEYYWDVEPWVEKVRALGMDVYNNEHRVLNRKGEAIVLAGVTDYAAHHIHAPHASDVAGAFEGAPEGLKRVLLAHQPLSLDAARAADVDLQLSGHTHGGQFFPWNVIVGLVQPVLAGLERFGKTWIYVSRGTGTWGPPMRSPKGTELTLIELKRA